MKCTEKLREMATFVVRWLSGSLSKSGPLYFGKKIIFLQFLSIKRVWFVSKAIYYFPVSYFCIATSQNCILAELRLLTVIRKVKFTDFGKRATSPKCSWRNFVFIQILRYIRYFDWRNMETFRKILSLPERLEDTLLWGLCSPTKI